MDDSPGEMTNLDQVIGVLRDYLDKRTTSQLDINRRLDFLVSQLGGISELTHRVDGLDAGAQQQAITLQSLSRIVGDAQNDFDDRTQIILRDAELLRGTLRDATTTFQQAQDNQNRDWDDRWQALRSDLDGLHSANKERAQAEATVTVSKISRSQAVAIAIITTVGALLVSLITQLLQQAK